MAIDSTPDQVLGRTVNGPLERPIGIPAPRGLSRVTMNCIEFTSMCPVTGNPDFGEVVISFIPGDQIVESKSLKLYLLKFRMEGVFCEALASQIAQEIFETILPQEVTVTVIQAPRGGIGITAESFLERPRSKPEAVTDWFSKGTSKLVDVEEV